MAVKAKPYKIEWGGGTEDIKVMSERLKEQLFRIDSMFETLFTETKTGIATAQAAATATSISLPDTDASHNLSIVCGSNLTADRILTITPGDASRTLTLAGNATISGTSSGTNTGDQTSISGNAATATALQTARTINGTSFDGTANITVTAAAGTLTGATLASGVTSSSLTTLGAAVDLRTTSANLGFKTGAGGTVTQGTSKATNVILDKTCGEITTAADALAANTTVSFGLGNNTIDNKDVIVLNHVSGGTIGAYTLNAAVTIADNATISIRNVTSGSLSEALVIRFAVIKAVTS